MTYNAVISSCDKRLQWQLALSLLKELQMQRFFICSFQQFVELDSCFCCNACQDESFEQRDSII